VTEKQKTYVKNSETDQVARALLVWLNEYPELPVGGIDYEYLSAEGESMAMSSIQSAYKTAEYIDGTYAAEYQFSIMYRIVPRMGSNSDRLFADETLNAIGDWASSRRPRPIIGTDKTVTGIRCNTRSTLLARYEDGSEDHQILMTMNYEVN